MQNSTLFRRAAALLLTAALALTLVLPGLAAYEMPIQTVNEGESVYLFNADIDKPILEQNADQQRYIASLTKMMTALLFLESGKDMNAEITIPASLTQEFKDIQNANGSTINLRIGETVRRIDLLYGLLVASANDAASVIASDVSDGDLTAFVARMNQRAKELGCTSTSFTCVHGLYDYGNVSSAHDLALIAKACAENETYMQVANTLSYTLPATNLHQNERTITSTNLMLNPEYPYYRDYIRGMKTGFTTLAGRCYVTFAQKDGHTYGLVVLGSDLDNIYREASEILDWAFASFSDRELVDTETPLTTAPLKKCRSYEEVELYAAAPVSGYGHADDKVTFTYDLQENISATVKDGAVLGTATVYLDGYEVGTVDLVTHQEYTNPQTIEAIHRKMDFGRVTEIVNRIAKGRNIHQHLDLIAGLPYEDYDSFRRSFADVYALRPQQLQLGFLKVLCGSFMYEHTEEYDCHYQEREPYEVLYTKWLPYDDVLKLKDVEEMVEVYYNSGQFVHTLPMIEHLYENPFDFFQELGDFYRAKGYSEAAHNLIQRYEILLEFLQDEKQQDEAFFRQMMVLDLYARENMKTRPRFAKDPSEWKNESRDFYQKESETRTLLPSYTTYDWKQLQRMTHVEVFDYDVLGNGEKARTVLLFDYQKRDPLTGNAEMIDCSELFYA